MTTLFRKYALLPTQGFGSRPRQIRGERPQILLREGIRMKPTPVNLHAKKLFEPDIAEVHFAAEMVQQRKLAGFVGRLEHHRIESERLREAIGISAIEVSLTVKKPHFFCALPGFHDELQSARIEPPPPLLDQLRYAVLGKRAGMLLAQLELNIQAPFGRHLDHLGGFQRHFRKTFATLDPRYPYVRAQVEISAKLPLCHRYLERSSSRDRRHMVLFRCRYLSSRGGLLRNHPASHGDLENGHQMSALLQVALERRRVVTRIKRAGRRRYFRDSDCHQIVFSVELTCRANCFRLVHCSPPGFVFTGLI